MHFLGSLAFVFGTHMGIGLVRSGSGQGPMTRQGKGVNVNPGQTIGFRQPGVHGWGGSGEPHQVCDFSPSAQEGGQRCQRTLGQCSNQRGELCRSTRTLTCLQGRILDHSLCCQGLPGSGMQTRRSMDPGISTLLLPQEEHRVSETDAVSDWEQQDPPLTEPRAAAVSAGFLSSHPPPSTRWATMAASVVSPNQNSHFWQR